MLWGFVWKSISVDFVLVCSLNLLWNLTYNVGHLKRVGVNMQWCKDHINVVADISQQLNSGFYHQSLITVRIFYFDVDIGFCFSQTNQIWNCVFIHSCLILLLVKMTSCYYLLVIVVMFSLLSHGYLFYNYVFFIMSWFLYFAFVF